MNSSKFRSQRNLFQVAALGLGIGICAAVSAGMTRDISVVQRPVVDLAPKAPALSIDAKVSRDDGVYKFGDKLSVEVTVSKDAYVTILNVGTSGKVHIVFPNEHQKDNFVRAGDPVIIPGGSAKFDLEIGPPAGVEVVKVIATLNPEEIVNPEDVLAAGPFGELKLKAPAAVRDISVKLNDKHDARWAEQTLYVKVEPR